MDCLKTGRVGGQVKGMDLALTVGSQGVALQRAADDDDGVGRALPVRQDVLTSGQVTDLSTQRQQRFLVLPGRVADQV